jgi:hypothetical protein
MQEYETVICKNTKNISIMNCKQIVLIRLSEFDWWKSHPRQESVKKIAANELSICIGWLVKKKKKCCKFDMVM